MEPKPVILMLMKPTEGDDEFYNRWREAGEVYVDESKVVNDKVTAIVTDFHTPINDKFCSRFKNLKFVVTPTTGLTHIDISDKRVTVLSLKGELEFLEMVTSVPEYIMRMILMVSRPAYRKIGNVLREKTLGIVGLGRIGKLLSQRAVGFRMKIIHVDKPSKQWQWDRLFSKSDFVSINLPEAPDTVKIVGPKLMDKMKPTAWLINTARPSVLDEEHLRAKLKARDIAGAVLDVTDLDWSDCDNAIVTPHIAGYTLEDRQLTDQFMIQKLKNYQGVRRVKEYFS